MIITPPLQIEKAGNVLLDYGLLGALVLALVYLAWHQYSKDQRLSDEYRKDAKQSNEKLMELSFRQTSLQEKQTELQEKQANQTKEFYDSIGKKIDEIPDRVMKEMDYKKLQEAQNRPHNTPAP